MADVSQKTYNELVENHEKIFWTRLVLIFFGLWLFFVPIAFGYLSSSKIVMINDMAMGVLVILFALFSFSPSSKFFPYGLAVIGIWLNFAPLAFWAPMGTMYLNDTLVGSLIIAFSILIPGVPKEALYTGPETPPGWSYNPSSWPQRLPTMCLAVVSWFLARYMAAFQLGYIDVMWDPFFGAEGTIKVITSDLSKSFPISDAGMGAMAYCLEFLLGAKGGVRRWYTMPWLVVCFGILVIPLGVVSIILVCSQPIIVGHWCTWCLAAAFCCMLMITFAVNEVVAVCQYILSEHKNGRSWWNTLWKGGQPSGATKDDRTPGFVNSNGKIFSCMRWGVTLPWNLLVTAACGIYLMVSPSIYTMDSLVNNFCYVTGALTVVSSFISLAEVVRFVRYFITVLGAWTIVYVVVFSPPMGYGRPWINLAVGALMILFSLPKGEIIEKYGSYDSLIK
ncbi:MAG: hypothetical protein S4CHLAM6_07340 [Chlamydiae bacterium]|nr:hypothetical protein [Chlamydiota bacterium]